MILGRGDTGPLQLTVDAGVPLDALERFLNASYVAVQKVREFGFADKDFAGSFHLAERPSGEAASGRYYPKTNRSVIYHPTVRGVQDWPWTVIHEIAHRIWHKCLTDLDQDTWSEIADALGKPMTPSAVDAMTRMVIDRPMNYSMWFFFKKHFGSDVESFKSWLLSKRVSDEFPTDYANSSPSEAFADVFAELLLGRPHSGKGLQRSGIFIRKVMLNILSRYRNSDFDEALFEEKDENFLQSQIDLPSLKNRLRQWADHMISPGDVLKWEHRPHVTLVYGADKRDIDEMRRIALDYGRPIRIVAGGLNIFDSSPDHDVLYIEAISPALLELRKQFVSLPNVREQRHPEYKPHITVAYMKKGTASKYLANKPLNAILSNSYITLIDKDRIEIPLATAPEKEPVLAEKG